MERNPLRLGIIPDSVYCCLLLLFIYYSRSLEYDAEQFAEQQVPMLVVGTKEVGGCG